MENYSKFIINKQALLANLSALPTKNVCAMVKANAYGHNLDAVCNILKGKVSFFGVANLQESLQIRTNDKYSNILVVGKCSDFFLAAKHNISVTIDSLDDLKIAANTNEKLKIHIKINTGMNRLGISDKTEFKKCLNFLIKNKKIVFEGIFTHFATLDCDKSYFLRQFSNFENFCNIIPPVFNPIKHVGGGEIVNLLPQNKLKNYMVRVGLRLYTSPNSVLKIKSTVIKIHTLLPCARVGYSNGFICESPHKIAVIPLGYADGINRKLSYKNIENRHKTIKLKNKSRPHIKNLCKKIYVKINNKKAPMIGNICMDMFFIDVSNIDCGIGDEVIVFEEAETWAKKCETIPYEILTSLKSSRMKYIIE